MLRSLYSGISGVKNQQASIDVISNNIANVNTTGYKLSRITFADALSDTLSSARGTAGNFGGSNPIQIGRGSMISSIDTNFKQGSVDATGIISDVAISGKGFFVVSDGSKQFYTRSGAFQIMSDGSLLSQGGSHYIMGRLADARGNLPSTTAMDKIVLPFGRKEPAKATENVEVYCNLDKNASKVEEWLGKDQMLSGGKPVTLLTDLAEIDDSNIMLGDEIEITGTDRNGNKILDPDNKIWTFTYGKDGTTMQDFIDKINLIFKSTNAETGATATLDQAGRLRLTSNSAGESDFSIQLTPKKLSNHSATTETRSATETFTTIQNNRINQLNGSAANMNYAVGDTVDITYNGETKEFSFATGNETIMDIVTFINNNFAGAKVALAEDGAPNQVQFVDLNTPPMAFSFSGSSGTATGLNGQTSFTLTGNNEPAIASTDLMNLLNMSLSHGKTINIQGTNPDGTYVSGTFTYGTTGDGTTVQDLLNTINKIFYGVTATINSNGQITMTDNGSGDSLSSISLTSGTAVGFDIGFETETFVSSNTMFVGGVPATITDGINTLDTALKTPYQIGDVITILASQMDGKTKEVNFTYGAANDGTTIADLINKINNSNEFPGLTASFSDGKIVFTDASLNDLFNYTSIQFVNANGTIGSGMESTFVSNAGTSNSNIKVPSFEQVQGGTQGKHHSAITVFDSSGQKHRIEITYTQDTTPGSNTWYWEVLVDDGKIVPHAGGSGYVTFNDNGSLRSFNYDNGSQLRFNVQGADEMKISFNGGIPGAFDGMTSQDSPSTNILMEQDGYEMGVLNNINIDDHGVITGMYSNKVSKVLAQIALANFTNEAGLQKEGNNLFAANGASGSPIIAWAGLNNDTVLKSGYLEASNVDLTDEFANLIIAQRALEANAKTVSTADMILSTIIDRMKR